MTTRLKSLATLLVLSLYFVLPVVASDPLAVQVSGAWIREAPPVSSTLAGYATLRNEGEEPVVIVSGSSTAFSRVEMHRTWITDGVVRMERQQRIELLPGERVVFEPGGYHFMLMGPVRVLREGERVEIVLDIEGGGTVTVRAIVRSGRPQ